MKKGFFLGLLLMIGSGSLYAADKLNPIITSVPSLTITPDARAAGMGDVGVATDPDVNSQAWNPAKYVFSKSSAGVAVNYTPWLKKLVDDINLLYVSGYYKWNELNALSASLRYFSLGEIELAHMDGSLLGVSGRPFEMAIDVSYSRMLSQYWSAAVALRYIHVNFGAISNVSGGLEPGNAFAADIAAYYQHPLDIGADGSKFAAGLTLSNLGTKISYDDGNTENYLPANMRLGGSFTYAFDEYNKLSVNLDLNKLMVPSTSYSIVNIDETTSYGEERVVQAQEASVADESVISSVFKSFSDSKLSEELKEIAIAAGLEYSYNNQFFLRGGYFYEDKTKGNRQFWTFGAGFKLNMLSLDASYSIASNSNPLDQTLRVSLAFDIDGIRSLINN